MSTPGTFDLGLEDFDVGALVANGTAVSEVGDEELQELQRLSRSISGQYVDVVVTFATQALRDRAGEAARAQVLAALDSLERLAAASHDSPLQTVLGRLREVASRGDARGKAHRTRFIHDLRSAVHAFADLLDGEDARRLRSLVAMEGARPPLLDQLAGLRGIGPKRLEALYCAGLFTVDALASASPDEVAAVTGLPLDLARDVVSATQTYATEQRTRCVDELTRRARELRAVLTALPRGLEDQHVMNGARQAIADLQQILADMTPPNPEKP